MLGSSVAVTSVAMLGGIGVLPSVASQKVPAQQDKPAASAEASVGEASEVSAEETAELTAVTYTVTPGASPRAAPVPADAAAAQPEVVAVPVDSGAGRRVVFSESQQRVWLVGEDETVERTYLVSGSIYDNLEPGTYAVYSRSEQAWGIDDSGSMRWFVRFTEGDNGGAIGFHDIPVSDGEPVQSTTLLGTPQSHGCIRQRRADALALWDFAPIGTEVVVTA